MLHCLIQFLDCARHVERFDATRPDAIVGTRKMPVKYLFPPGIPQTVCESASATERSSGKIRVFYSITRFAIRIA
jgi:hypothetical protein